MVPHQRIVQVLKDESIESRVDYTLMSVSRKTRGAVTRPWVSSFSDAKNFHEPLLDDEESDGQWMCAS